MTKEAAPAMDFKLASSLTGPFTAIARAMSGQWGIQVIPNGFRCATDTKNVIYIPFAADHLGESGRRALHGMLDHEVCHVVEEREHQAAGRAGWNEVVRFAKNRTMRMLLNVVEDIRIERKWAARYPGVAQNLMDCHLHVAQINKRDWGKAKRSFWDAFGLLLFTSARGVDFDMSWVGEKAAKALAECEDELRALDSMEWIQDSFDVAERIWTKLNRDAEETLERAEKAKKKPAEKPKSKKEDEPKGEPEPGDKGESGDEGKPSKEKSDDGEDLDADSEEGDDDGEGADGGDDDGADDGAGDDSDDEPTDDEAGDDESDEDAAGGSGSDESDEDLDDESEDEDGSSGAGSDGGSGDEPTDDEVETAKEILEAGEDGEGEAEGGASAPVAGSGSGESDPPTEEEVRAAREILESVAGIEDFVEMLADELEAEARADARKHRLYIPDPAMKKLDHWFKPEGGSLDNYMAAKRQVDAQIGAIRGKQLAFIQTITRKRLITGQDAGMLDQAALSTVRTGSLDVFADIKKGIALDTAIEVLLDLSGSMGMGDEPRCAAYYCKRIAIALAEAWEPLRIPNEFIGFSNEHGRSPRDAHDPDCVRRAPFDFHVFKAWGERLKMCRERFSLIRGHWDNADGEAVMAAAQRLALRPEKRKLLVVISDGLPCHAGIGDEVLNKHLKETVRKITRAGMEVLGVGAGTEAPKRFYNAETGAKNLIIKDLNTLAPSLFKTLRESILK